MQSSDDSPPRGKRWVPMAEAEVILGRKESTIRRWIKEGRVIGEQIQRDPDNPRDQRPVWRVLVDGDSSPAMPSESDQPPSVATEPSASAAWLQDKLDDRDETIREKDEQIADLNAELRAETARRAAAETAATIHEQRAVRAEGDRDAARQAAEAAQQLAQEIARQRDGLAERLARAEQERDAARRASWWARLLGRG